MASISSTIWLARPRTGPMAVVECRNSPLSVSAPASKSNAGMLSMGTAVACARQVKSIGYLAPFWIGRRAEDLGRFDGSFETLARDLVGVYLVVDIGVILLRRCHSENLVPML